MKTPLEIRADENHARWTVWIAPRRAAARINAQILADAQEKARKLDAEKARRDQFQREEDARRARELRKLAGHPRTP